MEREFDTEANLARLGKGAILVARDLQDPNFSGTAVLLCQFGPDGSYGLVLNRPSQMLLKEVFDGVPDSVLQREKARIIYVGGPVQSGELQIIQIGQSAPGAMQVAKGVFLGGAWTDLDSILSKDPTDTRLFLGYSGWGQGQLESEVEAGAWEVWKVDLMKLFLNREEDLFGGKMDLRKFFAGL